MHPLEPRQVLADGWLRRDGLNLLKQANSRFDVTLCKRRERGVRTEYDERRQARGRGERMRLLLAQQLL